MAKMFKVVGFFCLYFPLSAQALEITNYSVSATGRFHDVIVAFDDLGKSGQVRCVIRKDDKPVGMATEWIQGVGTVRVQMPGGVIGGTTATCEVLK